MVKLSEFGIRHIPDARTVRVVRDSDGQQFDVVRCGMPSRAHIRAFSYYVVTDRADLKNGKTAMTLVDVRKLIRSA